MKNKYIKCFESWIDDDYDKVINQIKQHNIGDVISNETLHYYTEALHGFDFDNSFITDSILKYDNFVLTELNIYDLDLESVSDSLRDEYKELYLKTKWYPPIIFDKDEQMIVDGYHRANALYEAGENKILAWIGV